MRRTHRAFCHVTPSDFVEAGRAFLRPGACSGRRQPEPRRDGRPGLPTAAVDSAPTLCASVEMTSGIPRSRAARACASLRSRRSTWQLISSASPCRETESITALMSNLSGSRLRRRRPVGWPSTSTHGHSMARNRRSVICWESCEKCRVDRCHDDVELSQAVVGEIEPAIGQDVALDSSEQREVLKAAVQRPDASGVFERASLVEAIGHRERLAVVGDGDVLATEPMRGLAPSSARSSRPSVSVVCM